MKLDGHSLWLKQTDLLRRSSMCYESEYQDNRHSSEMLALADAEKDALRAEVRRLRNKLQEKELLINLLRDDIAEHRPDPNAHLGGTGE